MGTIKRTLWTGAAVILALAGGVVALADTGQIAAPPPAPVRMAPLTADLATSQVGLSAPAGILINAGTGQVLYAKHVLARRYPASIVKLMTSLIALEMVKKGQLSLHSIVPVSASAFKVATTPGLSVAYLDQNQRVTLQQMLEFMYVVSADDAAVAIADDIAGTETAFAQLMNREARRLGMTGTHYTNASGLQNPREYTDARDVVILARYLIRHFPIVLRYASMPGMYIHPGQYGHNYDQMLNQYPGLDGLKTGSTNQAGYCFVGTALRGKTRLISVLLGMRSFSDVFQGTAALLDFGFHQFRSRPYQAAGRPLGETVRVAGGYATTIAVAPRRAVVLSVPVGRPARIEYSLSRTSTAAPIRAGQQLGVENIGIDGHTVLQVPVYALKSDPRAGLVTKLWRSLMASAHRGARNVVRYAEHRLSRLGG